MPRPKPASNISSAPQRHAAVLRTEGQRMRNESIRLENESKLLLAAADLLDKQPDTPRKPDPVIREIQSAA